MIAYSIPINSENAMTSFVAPFTTLAEVCEAVNRGEKVYWKNDGYQVIIDMFNTFFVSWKPWSKDPSHTALFHNDGTSSDYNPQDFFIYDR